MKTDRRALLEGIAFGRDPAIKPSDRIRALELLDGSGFGGDCAFCERVKGLNSADLQSDLDAATSTLLLIADDDELREQWPETARVLEQRVADGVRERLRQLEEAQSSAAVLSIVADK